MDDRLREERRARARTNLIRTARAVEYARINLEAAVKRFLQEPNERAYLAALKGRSQELHEARFALQTLDPQSRVCACGSCGRIHARRGA